MDLMLAIDLGTNTGWALCGPVGDSSTGCHLLKAAKEKPSHGELFRRFYRWLGDMHNKHGFKAIAVELVNRRVHKGTAQNDLHVGYRAILKMVCAQRDIRLVEIPVGTAKKAISGRGNASKKLVLECAKRLGWETRGNENAADAVAVYVAARKKEFQNERMAKADSPQRTRRKRKNDGGKNADPKRLPASEVRRGAEGHVPGNGHVREHDRGGPQGAAAPRTLREVAASGDAAPWHGVRPEYDW